MLSGPRLPDPGEQVDGRTLRPRGFSDDAWALLEHVWALMGMPCGGKYLVVMVGLCMNRLASNGEIGEPYEQRRVMRSAGRQGLVTAILGVDHCA
jgi:hypothetical protein